jgi:hypothetical protein
MNLPGAQTTLTLSGPLYAVVLGIGGGGGGVESGANVVWSHVVHKICKNFLLGNCGTRLKIFIPPCLCLHILLPMLIVGGQRAATIDVVMARAAPTSSR